MVVAEETATSFSLELSEEQTTLQKWVHEFAENVVRPILGWEKNPYGPGWPTGDVELDNPDVPHEQSPSPE